MPKNVTNNRKVVFEWNKDLGGYARRWRIDFYFFSFRIHKWLCSDDKRAFHSHPTNMLIYVLKGSYIDEYINTDPLCVPVGFHYYKAGEFRIIKRDYKHIIHIMESPTWTLVFTWGAPKRWSFWLRDTFKKKNRNRYFIEHGHHICDR